MTSRSTSALRKPAAKRRPAAKKSAANPKTGKKVGKLPEWNLADLYSGIDAPEIARDLARMDTDRQHQAVGQAHGAADHIEMAVGDGIERSSKKGCARHGGGLARARANRKTRSIGSPKQRSGTPSPAGGAPKALNQLSKPRELTIAFSKLHRTAKL